MKLQTKFDPQYFLNAQIQNIHKVDLLLFVMPNEKTCFCSLFLYDHNILIVNEGNQMSVMSTVIYCMSQ